MVDSTQFETGDMVTINLPLRRGWKNGHPQNVTVEALVVEVVTEKPAGLRLLLDEYVNGTVECFATFNEVEPLSA